MSVSVYTNRGRSTVHTEKKKNGQKAATARKLATHEKREILRMSDFIWICRIELCV